MRLPVRLAVLTAAALAGLFPGMAKAEDDPGARPDYVTVREGGDIMWDSAPAAEEEDQTRMIVLRRGVRDDGPKVPDTGPRSTLYPTMPATPIGLVRIVPRPR